MSAPPRTIVATRGGHTESHHEVHGIAVDIHGDVLDEFGDVDQHIYPRSSLKPFQAVPLVTSGAADRLGLADESLALACASHSGEPEHVRRVVEWLHDLDLEVSDLGCGAEPPRHLPSAETLQANHETATRAHNTCSGKHAGMLTLCRHLDAPVDSYLEVDHPVQRLIAEQVRVAHHLDDLEDPARDGCGAPIWRVPLSALARAVCEFDSEETGARLFDAMTEHPYLVGGTDRPCTVVMRASPDVVVKVGAEGVFVAAIRSRGIGLALKVADGATRAAGVALVAQLDSLGVSSSGDQLDELRDVALLDSLSEQVGSIRPGAGWND